MERIWMGVALFFSLKAKIVFSNTLKICFFLVVYFEKELLSELPGDKW